MHDDDDDMPEDWQQETESVRRLTHRRHVEPMSKKRPRIEVPEEIVIPEINERSGGLSLIEPGLLTRIKKGREPLEGTLDLHGMTQANAYEHLQAFVAQAYDAGIRTVLVITGKGQAPGGVLKQKLPEWLAAESVRPYVSGYAPAAPSDGGQGAWYVRIRRRHETG